MPDETTTASMTPPTGSYKDEDLVYVDPDTKTVVGFVEWSKNGNPKSKIVPEAPVVETDDKAKSRRRSFGRKQYPWGTYKSMKRVFQLEGKVGKRSDATKTLDDVMEKALKDAFWD